MNPDASDGHLDEGALDAIWAGAASVETRRHLDTCELCRRRSAQLAELAAVLAAPPPAIEIPEDLDRAIVELAGAAPARRDSRADRRSRRWLLPAAAVLVAAAVLLFVLLGRGGDHGSPRPAEQFAAGDINHDHQVDILDAYLVARTLDRGNQTEAEWDCNLDSIVDRADVEWLIRAAVTLGGRL